MATTEILITSGGPAAQQWLERLAQRLRQDQGRATLCLVATENAARRLEQQLLLDLGVPGLFSAPIRTFYRLARDIADHTRLGGHDLSDFERALLLQDLARAAHIPTLAPIRHFPGFVAALGDLIGELKLAMAHPADLRRALERLPRSESALAAKLRDLLTLYEGYQALLEDEQRPLHDAEGLMWHAVHMLEQQREIEGILTRDSAVFVHGFRNFNRVQLRLLRVIADTAAEVSIILHHDPTRADAFAATQRTADALRQTLGCEPTVAPPLQGGAAREHVAANLFRPDPQRRRGDESLVIIEAGSPALEADEVAREVRRLAQRGAACYSEIAIIVRDRETRQRFAHALRRHEVPLGRQREPLGQSAPGRALLHCLRAVRDGWPVSEVAALLASPCLPGAANDKARAQVSAWQHAVRQGREQWFKQWPDDDTLQVRCQALTPLRQFEERLRQAGLVPDMAAAARGLVAGFERPRKPEARRDDDAARQALEALIRSIELIAQRTAHQTDWQTFCDNLQHAVAQQTYDPGPRPLAGVAILDAQSLGGESYRVVFIVNLLEKVFPRLVRENPFLRDRERRLLADLGIGLDLACDLQDEERVLFWRAVSCAAERLYLSYPVADEEAQESLPSFYADEVRRLFEPTSVEQRRRRFADLVPAPAEAVLPWDWAICITHGLGREGAPAEQARVAANYNLWLQRDEARPDLYVAPTPEYLPALGDDDVVAALRERDAPYSPSELEAYLACPYLYYCERLLDLHPVQREVAAVDAGLLVHDLLARLYRELYEEQGGPVAVERLDTERVVARALTLLEESLERESRFANLPQAERDLERQRLAAILARFLPADLEQTAKRGLRPAYFEITFGVPGGSGGPSAAPLDLGQVEGRPVLIQGRMDRVDLTADHRAVVIDYKLNRVPAANDLAQGMVLQAQLYALAARQALKHEVAGTEYVSIRQGKRQGLYADSALRPGRGGQATSSPQAFEEALQAAAQTACECVARIRCGEMPRAPLQECPSWCAHRGICRMDAWTLRRLQAQRQERT